MGLYSRFCKRFFAVVIIRLTAQSDSRAHDDFDRGSIDPDRLRKAQQAWVSLVTSCKGVAFDIVNAEESASEAWAKLVQH